MKKYLLLLSFFISAFVHGQNTHFLLPTPLTVDTLKSKVSTSLVVDTTKSLSGNGTSVMAGTNATDIKRSWLSLVAARLGLTASNQGLGGYTLSNPPGTGAPSFLNSYTTSIPVKTANIKYLIYAWGENDPYYADLYCCATLDYSVARFTIAYDTVINWALARGWDATSIIIVSAVYQSPTSRATNTRQDSFYNASLAVANAYGFKFIDIYHPTKLTYPYDKSDGVHPSNLGHANIANIVLTSLDSLISVKNNPVHPQNVAINGGAEFRKLWVRDLQAADTSSGQLIAANGDGTAGVLPTDRFVKLGNGLYPQAGNVNIQDTAYIRKLNISGRTDAGQIVTTVDANIHGLNFGTGADSHTSNVAIGNNTLPSNNGDNGNTGLGSSALAVNSTGFFNTSIGYQSGQANQTGNQNVYIGVQAAKLATGSSNIVIGSQAALAASLNNKLVIGNSTTNSEIYGDMSTHQYVVGGAVAAPTLNSTWSINGSISTGYRAVTSTANLGLGDDILECTSGTFTVTLPTAVGIGGRHYIIFNTGVGTITLATTSSQTINGSAPGTITAGSHLTLYSNGANWLAY